MGNTQLTKDNGIGDGLGRLIQLTDRYPHPFQQVPPKHLLHSKAPSVNATAAAWNRSWSAFI